MPYAQYPHLFHSSRGTDKTQLACVNTTTPNAANQSSLCVDSTLQTEIAACVKRSCTVKENLGMSETDYGEEVLTYETQAAQNVTAYTCGWTHQDRSSLIKYGTVSLFVLATAAVAARITSRMPCYSGPLGPDDFVITMTWVRSVEKLRENKGTQADIVRYRCYWSRSPPSSGSVCTQDRASSSLRIDRN